MIPLIKRIFLIAFLVLAVFTLTVSASEVSLKTNEQFYVYGEENEELSKTIGMSETELSDYCKTNDIIYLAVNKENSKQIRVQCSETEFSESVVNISLLSNDKIGELTPLIAGIDNVKGEIIKKNGQKFIKIELSSSDSGGEFIITEYITVADGKEYTLRFYTDKNADMQYIEKTFEKYSSNAFLDDSQPVSVWQFVILAAAVVFAAVTVIIVITIIKDIKKEREETKE